MTRPTYMPLRGADRLVLPGGARYRVPPEPGTIMGPIYTGELVVVLGTLDGLTLFSYARAEDVEA